MNQTITQFFAKMHDVDFPYLVLRNFEGLPENVVIGSHGDLDLLVYDFEHWQELFPEAVAEHAYPRVRFRVPISGGNVYMDIRHVGDDYYPIEFEQAMLETREWNEKGFYTPNPIHHRLALAYHVVHHKDCNNYPKWLGVVTVQELHESLKKSDIGWVEPQDKTVGRFNAYWKGCTSVVEKVDGAVTKKQVSYGKYNLTENEHRILSEVSSRHFPKVLGQSADSVTLEDCGHPLSVDSVPTDWRTQLVQILLDLRTNKIQHRDIRLENLMMKDGVVKLIDFGWARLETDEEDNPPSCLGYPNKPSWGHDDNHSMRVVIKQLEHKLEECYENIGS